MRFLRSTWHVGRWCTRKGLLLALWTVWLLLLVTLGAQIYVFTSHELVLPAPVRSLIEQKLAAQGISLAFDRGLLDPSGNMLLENVRLGTPATSNALVTARSLHAKLKPWLLVAGRLEIEEIGASGLDLHLPAMLSASGRDETLAGDIDFTVRPHERLLEISHLTGRIAGLSVQADGAVRVPFTQSITNDAAFVENLVAAYLKIGKQVQAVADRLDVFDTPLLDVQLTPLDDRIAIAQVTLRAKGVTLPPIKNIRDARLGPLSANARFIIGGKNTAPIRVTGLVDSVELPGLVSARDLRFTLLAAAGDGLQLITPRLLELQFASLNWRDIAVGPSSASIAANTDPMIEADLSVLLAGSPWAITGAVDPAQGAGRVTLDGRVDAALLAVAGGFAKRDLKALLEPAEPAPLNATATLLGWQPARVEGRLHSGPVRVGTVQLEETGTEFTYAGSRVLCDNLVLRQGESLAHGSYEMDTATKDFRFLLTGGLRPLGISGWFHGWWPNFWKDFDFTKSVPQADVDVAGRWGSPTATHVFVQVEGAATGLRGAAFDRVSARLFIRPQWADIIDFKVVQDGRAAGGSFSRLADFQKKTWLSMIFSVESGLALETIEQLLGKDASVLLKPYRFASPPGLKVSGITASASSPGGASQHINIALQSSGSLAYHGFPLADLSFTAQLHDGAVDIPALALEFAGGKAAGKARIWGEGPARRISFDASLTGARLGAAIKAVAPQKSYAAPPDEKTKGRNQRLEQGRLNLNLAAEGLFSDLHSFNGTGSASITDAELGQLNLLGPLSELLSGTILNFSSFSLTTLHAQFDVEGPLLKFGSVKITGPSAALDAKGDCDLRDHSLDFKARIFPFDESKSLVGNTVGLVLSPFSNVLEVKLQGTLEKPSWIFAYGPTRILRTLTGGNEKSAPPANKPATDTAAPAP